MILVAEEATYPRILNKASELDDFEYAGLVLSDRDANRGNN